MPFNETGRTEIFNTFLEVRYNDDNHPENPCWFQFIKFIYWSHNKFLSFPNKSLNAFPVIKNVDFKNIFKHILPSSSFNSFEFNINCALPIESIEIEIEHVIFDNLYSRLLASSMLLSFDCHNINRRHKLSTIYIDSIICQLSMSISISW